MKSFSEDSLVALEKQVAIYANDAESAYEISINGNKWLERNKADRTSIDQPTRTIWFYQALFHARLLEDLVTFNALLADFRGDGHLRCLEFPIVLERTVGP